VVSIVGSPEDDVRSVVPDVTVPLDVVAAVKVDKDVLAESEPSVALATVPSSGPW